MGVRTLLCTLLLASPWAMARNDAADRAAVDKVIFALKDALRSQNQDAVSKLLAAGTNRPELSKTLLNLNPAAPESKPWPEVSRPVLMIDAVTFPERDRALVNVTSMQYGSVTVRNNAQVVFLLKREKSGWKIESLRVGPPAQ